MKKGRAGADGASASKELDKRLESKVLGMMGRQGGRMKGMAGEAPDAAKAGTGEKEAAPAAAKGGKAGAQEKAAKPAKEEAKPKEEKPVGDKAAGAEEGKAATDAAPKPGKKPQPKKEPELPTESLSELNARKEEIETLLSSVEDSYREATLPEEAYEEVKRENEKKLQEIERGISALKASGYVEPVPEAAPAEVAQAPRPAQPQEKVIIVQEAAKPEKHEDSRVALAIKDLEGKMQDKLREVITSASIEVTDKRLRKTDERIDAAEAALKELKHTAQAVEGFEKQFSMMSADVERSKALVESGAGARKIMDDKVQRIVEGFAEIRSIVYQREAVAKEQEVLINKLKDVISHVDTARTLKEFTIRDEQIKDVNTRLEKLERGNKMLNDTMTKIRGLLTDVGSLENVIKASKMVGEKLEKIQEIEDRMRTSSSKLDGIYVDMKKKLDEFATYKVRQDKLDGMAQDMFRNVEEVTRRLADFVSKDDLEGVRKQMLSAREEMMASAGAARPLPQSASMQIAALQEEKDQIETLLSTLEENLKGKELSQGEYDSAKVKSLQKLAEIDRKVAALSEGGARGAAGEAGEERKHGKAMLLAKLRESYENGEISKAAYDRGKRLLMKKG